MRVFSLIPALIAVILLQVLVSPSAVAVQGTTPGYDKEFSQFLQSQGAKNQPSVVVVETRFTRWITENGKKREITTEGDFATGFFYNEDGIVVTQYSVVTHPPSSYYTRTSVGSTDASYILVRLADGRQYEADVIGTDPTTSIAVLKCRFIDPKDSKPVTFGDSTDVIVGEPILFLGYNWITRSRISYNFGVISALRPKFPTIEESTNQYFQVNVAQNYGNEGGIVVNSKGQVIAVMTEIAPYPDATEIHFGLPINIVKEVVDSILDIGEMHRPWFGFRLLEMTPQIERAYSILDDKNGDGLITDKDRDVFKAEWAVDLNESLFVIWVDEKSPAGDAGLREGDILTKFNGVAVPSMAALQNQIEKYRIGDKVTIEWIRREYAVWDPYMAEITIEYYGQRDEKKEE